MKDHGYYYESGMVDGNTARKLQAVPKRREEERPLHQPRRTTKPKKRKMDVVTFLIFSISVCIAVYICLSYVEAQSNILVLDKEILGLEKEIANIKKQNDALLEVVESSIDLDEIYKTATKELGMVHAKKSQVYKYEYKKSDRVRQYADIPSN